MNNMDYPWTNIAYNQEQLSLFLELGVINPIVIPSADPSSSPPEEEPKADVS